MTGMVCVDGTVRESREVPGDTRLVECRMITAARRAREEGTPGHSFRWLLIGAMVLDGAACFSRPQAPPSSHPDKVTPIAVAGEAERAEANGSDQTSPPQARDEGKPGSAAAMKGTPREWTGVVKTGLMAFGGETTGITLTATAGIFELRATGAALETLQRLDGKRVTVRGLLREVAGIETRRMRRIINVTAVVTR
jgi:hypothetical protein